MSRARRLRTRLQVVDKIAVFQLFGAFVFNTQQIGRLDGDDHLAAVRPLNDADAQFAIGYSLSP